MSIGDVGTLLFVFKVDILSFFYGYRETKFIRYLLIH